MIRWHHDTLFDDVDDDCMHNAMKKRLKMKTKFNGWQLSCKKKSNQNVIIF